MDGLMQTTKGMLNGAKVNSYSAVFELSEVPNWHYATEGYMLFTEMHTFVHLNRFLSTYVCFGK